MLKMLGKHAHLTHLNEINGLAGERVSLVSLICGRGIIRWAILLLTRGAAYLSGRMGMSVPGCGRLRLRASVCLSVCLGGCYVHALRVRARAL